MSLGKLSHDSESSLHYCHLPLLLGAGALGLVDQAEGHVPLVVLVELHEDDDEADELDRVEDEAHGERDLDQGYKVLN